VPRTSKQPEERRRELEAAAAKLFSDKGYADTSVSDIVKAVGVAQGTFYYHFKSKDEVLEAVVERIIRGLAEEVQRTVEDESLEQADRLDRVLALLLSAMLDNRQLISLVQHPGNMVLNERMRQRLVTRLEPALLQLVRDGARHGAFDVPHADEAADLLLATVVAVARLGLPGRKPAALARLRETVALFAHRALGV